MNKMLALIILIVFGMVLLMQSVSAIHFWSSIGYNVSRIGNETFNDLTNFSIRNASVSPTIGSCSSSNGMLACSKSYGVVYAPQPNADGNTLPNLTTNTANFTMEWDMNASTCSGGYYLAGWGTSNKSNYNSMAIFNSPNINLRDQQSGFTYALLISADGTQHHYTAKFWQNSSTVQSLTIAINRTDQANAVIPATFMPTSFAIGEDSTVLDNQCAVGADNLTIYNGTVAPSVPPDTALPKNLLSINTTNSKINFDINYSALCTDETALLSGNFSVNTSGIIKYSNYTLSGTSTNITNGTTITTARGSVINVTSYCTDTSNNVNQNSTLITVADTLSTITLGLNLTSIKINNVQNISCNATDPDVQFSIGTIAINLSGNPYLNFSFTPFATGYSLFNFSQAQSFNLTRGNVINSTCLINDTFETTVQVSTKSTILDTLGSILLGTNITTVFKFVSVGNFSGNVTEFDKDISSGIVSYNISGNPQLNFSFVPAQTGYNYFNFSQAITINKTRGTPINFTVIYNDSAGTNVQISILLVVNNTPPVVVNVSLSNLPLSQGDTAKGHCNFTDADLDLPTGNQTVWYINGSQVPEANNTFILNAPNVTNNAKINFSCRYNDTEYSNWVNSTTATVGDLTAPTILNQSISGNSFITTDLVNVSETCIDNVAVATAYAEINSTNITLTNIGTNVFADARTYALGNHNVTNFYCLDGNGNSARDLSNFTFTVSNPPSGGGSSSGGGGGSPPPIIIVNQTNATIENCNQNKICEKGEDLLGCPTDCKLNTNFITCDDPTQSCIKDALKNLFSTRDPVLRASLIIALIAGLVIFTPISEVFGIKLFKKKNGTRRLTRRR